MRTKNSDCVTNYKINILTHFWIKASDKSLGEESRVHRVGARFRGESKHGKQATSKGEVKGGLMNAAWSRFSLSAVSIGSTLSKIKKVLQLCGFESRRETGGGCQAKGWTGAWINGQPGYFHMGWQSEPTDHRSLARRSNSRVPSVVWPMRQQWKPSAREVVEGREGSEIGSAINVDLKTYSLLQPELLPAVSQTRT